MNEAITNKKIVTLVFGVLFLGGLAAMFGIYRAAQHGGHPPFYV
jgi:hypothetical protein